MNLKKQITGGLMIYITIRIFSYFFSPGTPLYTANPINWIISAGILATAIYFLLKKDIRGWLIIAAEIILGGAGSFLEINGIALRTLLLISSLGIFLYHTIKEKKYTLFLENKTIFYLLTGLLITTAISVFHGFYFHHAPHLIIADTVPYFFFLYYFPLKQLLQSEPFRRITFGMILSAIIGNCILMYITLVGFSSKLLVLQDNYYHWFRDIASGKITEYGFNFYRIVLNEHLLLIPLLIFFISRIIVDKKTNEATTLLHKILFGVTGALVAILAVNLTRIYILALGVGLLFLFSKTNWKRWFVVSTATVIGFIIIFTTAHLATSRGKNLGWEFFGLRLQSITAPQTEESSLSRVLLLPKILEKIKNHPVLGNGLGDTVTVYSPVFKQNITTPHFDWGYLEIIAEMGMLGLLIWLSLVAYALRLIAKQYGLPAALLALLVINLTSPALFHVMGIIFITLLLAKKVNPNLPSTQA
ncbi:MAG: O-antigen ligase family protein [Candidatus Magasanikbacteria bacterium]|nr:O-antigen ligase family protein [Candidatus Magasanikbacteria bacterium]